MTSDIIVSKKGTTRANQKITYTLNKDLIKFHIQLNMYANPYLINFDDNLLMYVGIEKKQKIKNDDMFIEDDDNIIALYKSSQAHHLDFGINEEDKNCLSKYISATFKVSFNPSMVSILYPS